MIVAAAIRYEGKTFALPAPARHGDILNKWRLKTSTVGKFGFIDSEHGFVDRRDAWMIAEREGQILVKDHPQQKGVLFSEDVW